MNRGLFALVLLSLACATSARAEPAAGAELPPVPPDTEAGEDERAEREIDDTEQGVPAREHSERDTGSAEEPTGRDVPARESIAAANNKLLSDPSLSVNRDRALAREREQRALAEATSEADASASAPATIEIARESAQHAESGEAPARSETPAPEGEALPLAATNPISSAVEAVGAPATASFATLQPTAATGGPPGTRPGPTTAPPEPQPSAAEPEPLDAFPAAPPPTPPAPNPPPSPPEPSPPLHPPAVGEGTPAPPQPTAAEPTHDPPRPARSAAPERPWRAAVMLGIGVTFDHTVAGVNPLGFGFGLRGDYHLRDEFRIGARVLYFVGGSSELPTGKYSMSSWLLAAEGAYVLSIAPLRLEPGLALGVASRTASGRPAFAGSGTAAFVPGSENKSEAGLYVAPGIGVILPMEELNPRFKDLFVGLDARLDLVFGAGVTSNLQLLFEFGLAF